MGNNPGLGQAGLYYHYSKLAKFTDAKGGEDNWRNKLLVELAERQKRTAPESTPTRNG